MLIVFPLGLLPTSLVLDCITLANKDPRWSEMAFWLIAGGVAGGLLAAVFGLIDWLAIPAGTRAKSIGAVHGLANVVVVAFFTTSWLLRMPQPGNPGMLAIGLSVLGIIVATVAGWLGGELVERMGVSVDPGAHLNSSSSLSGRPASESVTSAGRSNDSPAPI
jgi:uncharacterized membrane protein